MLSWYSESVEQYELPGDRFLMVFDEEMTVNILTKSSAANLKKVNEAIAAVFGRPMEQVIRLKPDAQIVIKEANSAAAADKSETASPVAGGSDASTDNSASQNAAETAADIDRAGFENGVNYFENLARKMNFKIDRTDS